MMRHINRLVGILTEFRGSIDRQAFWTGSIVIGMAYLFSPFRPPTVDGILGPPTVISELWTYGWLIPLAAVNVKRVNDIGWPSWLGYALAAIVGLSFIPWSIGLLPLRSGEMSVAASYGIKAFLLVWGLGFSACAFMPGGWRQGYHEDQASRSTENVAPEPPTRQNVPARTSAMWMWGLFMGSIATVGFGALAGRIFALVRRQQLEGTPFASHVKTATKVFDVSVLVVVFAAIATHELTKIPAFASLAADHMVDTAFVSFVFVLLPAWLSLWGVFGFLRAKRGEPFGRP